MKQTWIALLVVLFALESKAQMFWGDGSFLSARIVSVNLIDGKLFVEKREASNITYCEGGHPPDSVWKEIYCASNGVIVLERKVEGTVVPPQTTPERIEWPDAESRKVPSPPWQSVSNWTIPTNNLILCAEGYVGATVSTNSNTNAVIKAKENSRGK